MKKRFLSIPVAAVVLTALGVTGCGTTANQSTATTPKAAAFPVTLKDDAGHAVTVSKQPTRIASTTEGTDEILSGLVPKKDIVLVTTYASDPTYSNIVSFAKGVPSISQANAEQIIASNPDLVLMASYTKAGVVQQVEQANIASYEFNDFNSIQDIEKNIEVVGKLVGQEAKAKQLVSSMQSQIASVKAAIKGKAEPTVLDYSSFGYAAGSSTTVNDIIVDAGGINAASSMQGWQKITDEEIVKMNPQVIIDSSDDKAFIQKILNDPALKSVSAVQHQRVYSMNSADLGSVSQYVIKGVVDLAKVLYPSVQFSQ